MNAFKDGVQERVEGQKHTELYQEYRYHRERFIAPFCYIGACNTQLFNTWLKQILIPELKPGQVIILDNASFPKSKESLEIIEKAGYEVLLLPPYSPDLNPIEKFWAHFKKRVKEALNLYSSLAEAID